MTRYLFIPAALLLLSGVQVGAQTVRRETPGPLLLRNNHVLVMVDAGVPAEVIISKIENAACAFDTFPPVLRDLKARGVPDSVLGVMLRARNGLLAPAPAAAPRRPQALKVLIPAGTVVELEAPRAVNSSEVKEGADIFFRVARPVRVKGLTVIATGAQAAGRVLSARGGGVFGRPGELVWVMESVVAVDGSRLALRAEQEIRGETKSEAVASGAAATAAVAAITVPPAAPAAILWGMMRGDDATIHQGKRFNVALRERVEVIAFEPQTRAASLHDVNKLKAIDEQQPASLPSLRFDGILRRD